MGEEMPTSIRSEIMELLKTKFKKTSFWSRLEPDIALMCANLTEPTSDKKRNKFVDQLKFIKSFLLKEEVYEEDLIFLDEEIKINEKTKMISLYVEKDDSIEDSVIAGYSRLGKGSEGIIAIPQDYNYSQLSQLTNGVYKDTGLVKFYISQERTLYGKIVAEIYEHSQEIPIASVVESKKVSKETGEPEMKGIKLFGQKFTKTEFNLIKEINIPFYVYRFITEGNKELILLTLKQYEIGDYVVTGVQTECEDNKMLTDSARLPTKLPFLFAQSMRNRIIKFKNHDEFKQRLIDLNINEENFLDYPFSVSKDNQNLKTKHPKWYKRFIWAWLTHEAKGIINSYPLHLLIIGPKMSGKSLLLNSLHSRSKETRSIFSGSSSTLKHLVPSFKYNPARIGYLAESNRFSFCDEFLRCLTNTKSTADGSQREESVAMMNDLLEHQKREAGSGVSRINVNMTSRIIAMTNPVRNIKNVESLINNFDESFLSRWLVYYQTEDQVHMIRSSKDSDLEQYDFKISINDWVSFLDYLQTFSAKYDLDKINEIHQSIPKILSENLNKHYDARHRHHIECLMDGIVKTRCLFEKDMSFKANKEDYETLKTIWFNVIKSWLDTKQIRNIDVSERINYLPENCQYIYWKICEQKQFVSRKRVEEIALKAMSKGDYIEAWNILLDMGVIIENNGFAKPYYFLENKDKQQKQI